MSLLFFILLFKLSKSCTKIRVESLDDRIDWLDGVFIMDPTLVADGRPVYVEQLDNEIIANNPDVIKRSIYHYSHERNETEASEYSQTNFHGRWILGNSMYSSNGWTYINTWSISPTNNFVNSLINYYPDSNTKDVHPKAQWRLFFQNEWQLAQNTDQISVHCDTMYDTIINDWLFISTPNKYNFNFLNNNKINDNELTSITQETLHGFYYRISKNFWRKIESNIYLRRRDLKKDPLKANSFLSSIFGSNNDKDIQYSFMYYGNYTNIDGTPDLDKFSGYQIITSIESTNNDLSLLSSNEWYIINDNDETQGESIEINVITIDNENDDIYSAYRRYWSNIKLSSFNNTLNKLNINDDDDFYKLIKITNNNLPFLMSGLGTGGLVKQLAASSLNWAINDIGYRVIDSSEAYQSEEALGNLIQKNDNNFIRNDLYIISKVWPTNLGFIQTYQSILTSLNKIQTNYIDLYMIHWNRCNPDIKWMNCEQASDRPWGQSWQVMEKLYAEGILLNIGISNYDFETFNHMIDDRNIQIIPQVIQNYFDIAHADWELAEYVNQYNVIYQGYAQYRGIAESEERAKDGQTHYNMFKNKLSEISSRNTNGLASESQILLRWLIEKNIAVIPRSSNFDHLKENWNIWNFKLNDNDINILTELSKEQNKKIQKGEL